MSTELGQSGQSRISRESCFLFPGARTIIVRCKVPSALLADDGIKAQQANLRSSWIRNLSLNCASGSTCDFCSQCSSAKAASNAGAERAELNDMLRIDQGGHSKSSNKLKDLDTVGIGDVAQGAGSLSSESVGTTCAPHVRLCMPRGLGQQLPPLPRECSTRMKMERSVGRHVRSLQKKNRGR
jgi:hypothetical protein